MLTDNNKQKRNELEMAKNCDKKNVSVYFLATRPVVQ